MNWQQFIEQALREDIGEGDHTSLACVEANVQAGAVVVAKETCIVAGVDLACMVFRFLDVHVDIQVQVCDGQRVPAGSELMYVRGRAQSLLAAERLALNCLQRMSGIATLTRRFVDAVYPYRARILDTRKTTPLFRAAEKWAVRLGGGVNHRLGLYDMILIKDNHIDFCGGVEVAIDRSVDYLQQKGLQLPIEIEARNLDEVQRIVRHGGVQRIMLDNFSLPELAQAVQLIGGRYETEASGGITLDNVYQVAATGVDYISVGALTHAYRSVDISMKAATA
ncbi:MAG: carboxylating nicotinate-nucleotide diphosphorylase [Chitinophagales bacterium]|nr:carboxylating nicotinate-nucleotide diphosphorylase [Chitinophagales bacterium]MDW8428791.1 carboxylating nicotinate-nucleotide diphosphorylase [Chitinophagales bacterium]